MNTVKVSGRCDCQVRNFRLQDASNDVITVALWRLAAQDCNILECGKKVVLQNAKVTDSKYLKCISLSLNCAEWIEVSKQLFKEIKLNVTKIK